MPYTTQDDVDAAFAALDELLAERQPQPTGGCVNCGGHLFDRGTNAGYRDGFYDVCQQCGAVVNNTFGFHDSHYVYGHSLSNYKRIHHWHERISQLLLQESPIPVEHFEQIATRLLDGTHAVINKDVIRSVLRSLNMQLYIEKWLQITQRITGIEPPKPGAQLLNMLDSAFTDLQQPFNTCKVDGRKNFLNYNYVFCRLLQRVDCPQFCMFFPLIKSKQKLRVLDDMWVQMVKSIGWEVKPLQIVPQFAVKLEQPERVLEQLRQQGAFEVQAVKNTMPSKTGFRKSDLNLLRALDRPKKPKRPRSNQLAQELQTLGSSVKRPRSATATKLQSCLRSRHRA